jgi:hypothetical protein
MTLTELLTQCQDLVDAGFGDNVVIKASDGEGNTFISVGSIKNDRVTGGPYRFESVSEDEEEEYDQEDYLINVICVW